MITNPQKVPQKEISSVDITSFEGGWYLNGDQNAPANAFVKSKDVELTLDNYIVPRRRLLPFLPDTVGTSYQKFPVLWQGQLYYFTADDGKVKYCTEQSGSWTDCADDPGADGPTNVITTNNGGMTKFLRVLDKLLIINGKNGDKLALVDLAQAGFPVIKFDEVADPETAPTATLTGLSAGSYNVYYATSFSGAIGQTKLSPILTESVSHVRDEWASLSTPGSIEITRGDAVPAGARYWNVYVAIAAPNGTIQPEDMLLLASGLDINTDKFVDNGTLPIQLGQPAPLDNSTEGPRVDQGIVADGNPILWADQDNPYNIWIGGGGVNALSFSTSDGGYRAEPEMGTNYYPTAVIGFRTGPGAPALTVLFSNTEGMAKQAVLQQQTITYGEHSFSVWGVTEQYYGAAGVAAPNSAINYNGKLLFFSTDGLMSMESQPATPNVLNIKPVSTPIDPYIRSIKISAMSGLVGTGWNNKYMWCVPSNGFDTPQQILVLDTNNKGIQGNGAFYTLNIPAQWIGVISPPDATAFVYVSQGNKTYKLVNSSSTFDTQNGVSTPFSTSVTGPLIGVSGAAHNTWQANVQVMFYILELVGQVEIGVTYRNLNGRLKTKSKIIEGPSFTPSTSGGWGDPQWNYAHFPLITGYGASPVIDDTNAAVQSRDVRKPVRIDDIMNEAQWWVRTPVGFNYFKLRAVSLEGINLGVRPDLQ